MAKSVRKKEKKERARIERQIEQAVKQATRVGKFIAFAYGMYGNIFLMYLFGPGMNNQERKKAIRYLAESFIKHRPDVLLSDEYTEYPADILNESWESVYLPHKVFLRLREVIDGDKRKSYGITPLFRDFNISKAFFIDCLITLHNYNVIRVDPLGQVWFKDDIYSFVQDDPDLRLLTPQVIHPGDIR